MFSSLLNRLTLSSYIVYLKNNILFNKEYFLHKKIVDAAKFT